MFVSLSVALCRVHPLHVIRWVSKKDLYPCTGPHSPPKHSPCWAGGGNTRSSDSSGGGNWTQQWASRHWKHKDILEVSSIHKWLPSTISLSVFNFSEEFYQCLERMRAHILNRAAVRIQAAVKMFLRRKHWPQLKFSLQQAKLQGEAQAILRYFHCNLPQSPLLFWKWN